MWGEIIAKAGGATGGAVAGLQNREARKKAVRVSKEGNQQIEDLINQQYAQRSGDLANAYQAILQGYDPQEYLQQLRSADMSKYDIQAPEGFEFDYQKATEANLNPMLDAIVNRSAGAIESSSANRGSLFSGATAKKIARSTADIQAQEYGRAQNLAMQQGQNKYQQFMDSFQNALRASDFNRQGSLMNLQNQGQAFNIQNQANQQQIQGQQALGSQYDLNKIGLAQDRAQIEAENAMTPGFWGSILPSALGGSASASTAFRSETSKGGL